MSRRRIAVVIPNPILFETIQPLLEHFKEQVTVLLPQYDAPGWREMFDVTKLLTERAGYHSITAAFPYTDPNFTIELSAYPFHSEAGRSNLPDAPVRIRFLYGLAKEAWNFSEQNSAGYTHFLCYGPYDSAKLAQFGETLQVGAIKLAHYQPKSVAEGSNTRVLYLPTYSQEPSAQALIRAAIEALVQDTDIIFKPHHGSYFLEASHFADLISAGRVKVVPPWTALTTLFSECDAILSDNSGAIFDAIAADKPVALYQKAGHSNPTHSLEYSVVDRGMLPCARQLDELKDVLLLATRSAEYKAKRRELQSELFGCSGIEGIKRASALLDAALRQQ